MEADSRPSAQFSTIILEKPPIHLPVTTAMTSFGICLHTDGLIDGFERYISMPTAKCESLQEILFILRSSMSKKDSKSEKILEASTLYLSCG